MLDSVLDWIVFVIGIIVTGLFGLFTFVVAKIERTVDLWCLIGLVFGIVVILLGLLI